MPSHVTKKRKTSATTDVKKKNVSVEKKDKSASPSASEASDSESSTGGIDINEASGSEASIDNGDEFPLSSENDSDSDSDNLSDILSTQHPLKKRKRNDPAVFSTTMSKILSSHLTTTARKDPVLVRAKHSAAEIDESKIEAKARRVLREEKRKDMEKGRVRDVVPRDDDEAARRALELEKRLRKTAQRGVVKLFNAVRAAQIKAEEGSRVVKKEGVVGIGKRGEKVTEMSKQGFLSLIQQSGGK